MLGLIFFRYADHKFGEAEKKLSLQGSGRRRIGKTDFQTQGVLFLPETARFARLLKLPEGTDIGNAINEAMKAIEAENEDLRDVVPKTYNKASATGTPLNENNLAKRVLKPISKSLGIGWISWHTFRHTHATLSDQLNIAFVDRQAAMGYDDLRMTVHYTQEAIERRREGVERLTERILTL